MSNRRILRGEDNGQADENRGRIAGGRSRGGRALSLQPQRSGEAGGHEDGRDHPRHHHRQGARGRPDRARPGDPGEVADLRHRRRVLRRGRRPGRDRPAALLDQPRSDAARARRGRARGRARRRSPTTGRSRTSSARSRCGAAASWPRDAFDARQKDFDQARITLEQEKDKLALLKEGRIVAQGQRRRLGDPRLGGGHGARAQGQPRRSGRAADLLPGGHGR